MKINTDDLLRLEDLSEATANAAVRTLANRAESRADLLMLLDQVRPAPHSVAADPSARRAQPRTTR